MHRRARPSCTLTAIAIALATAVAGACEKAATQSADAGTDDAGVFVCSVDPPTVCPDPPPHYPAIVPIVQERCVPCHNGLPGGPWPLLQYSHLADWQDVIRGQMIDCSMPPPDAGVPMENSERIAILTWILCGYLE